MRLTIIAKMISGLAMAGCLCSSAMAATPVNSWYAGAKAGWSDYYNSDIGHDVAPATNNNTRYTLHGDNATGGVFMGYQALDWLALEGGYDYLGNASVTSNNTKGARLESQGLQLGVKLSVPLMASWDLYARGGMMGWVAKVKSDGRTNTDNGVSPLAALGTEVAVSDNFALRLEYQYTANVGNGGDNGVEVDNGQTSLGLIYRFGASTPVSLPPAPTPVAVVPAQHINLDTMVHFDTGSSELSDNEQQALKSWLDSVNTKPLAQPHMIVTGYADRTGKAGANQTLSEERANTVADFLRSQPANDIPVGVRGKGDTDPVTGDTCLGDSSHGSLKQCLAPDRRVEIAVHGIRDATF